LIHHFLSGTASQVVFVEEHGFGRALLSLANGL